MCNILFETEHIAEICLTYNIWITNIEHLLLNFYRFKSIIIIKSFRLTKRRMPGNVNKL